MKKKIIMLIVLVLFSFNRCNQYEEEEIEVGSMTDYFFIHDIEINNKEDAINYVSNNIIYKDELFDYWQLPEETYNLKTGDCEDFSLLLCYLLENELDIRTKLIIIGKDTERHILVKYNLFYIEAIHGYIQKTLNEGWYEISSIPYSEAIWMTYYYHNNVGKYE